MVMIVSVPMIVTMRRSAGPDALDVVVVAFLRQADFGLEAQHLLAVLAHLAVHVAGALQDLGHPVDEGLEAPADGRSGSRP